VEAAIALVALVALLRRRALQRRARIAPVALLALLALGRDRGRVRELPAHAPGELVRGARALADVPPLDRPVLDLGRRDQRPGSRAAGEAEDDGDHPEHHAR